MRIDIIQFLISDWELWYLSRILDIDDSQHIIKIIRYCLIDELPHQLLKMQNRLVFLLQPLLDGVLHPVYAYSPFPVLPAQSPSHPELLTRRAFAKISQSRRRPLLLVDSAK